MKGRFLAVCLLVAAGTAAAQQLDPVPHAELIGRFVAACQQFSAAECEFGEPPTPEDAARLACLFDQLDTRAGEATAAAHVDWAERYAATGEPPETGFPSSIGEQQVLMASLIACRPDDGTR